MKYARSVKRNSEKAEEIYTKRWGGSNAVFLNPEKDNKNYEKMRQLF
ncbi:MAG: hypothetical protein R6W70_01330 [bacterium]